MPAIESITVSLLAMSITVSVVLLFVMLRILKRLERIELRGNRKETELASTPDAPPAIETSPGGAFEMFLEEDSARLKMTKSEQFKAYRKWRQEKGMNWSNS
jgi:hypothetical protein